MNGFLLDTHVWLWHLHAAPNLPAGLRALLEDEDVELWLSPVSIWEVGLLHERRRFDLARSLREWVGIALTRVPLREAPLTNEVATTAAELELHRDPADRFLAATALVYDLTLMTLDPRLMAAPWLPTRSE